jgi:transcriptional regulator with XRE-family HTH domain
MTDKRYTLGVTLKALREKKGLSQVDMARIAGIGRSTLVHLENGADVRLSKLTAVARVLGVEIEPVAEPGVMFLRKQARLQNAFRMQALQSAHRRIALDLIQGDPAMARAMIEARRMVGIWERDKTCSPFYIKSWKAVLRGSAREVGKALSRLDEKWELALLQNTPFGSLIARRSESGTA